MRCFVSENRVQSVVVPDQLQVYFVCGTQDTELNKKRLLEIVEDACRGGITCFQFREKGRWYIRRSTEVRTSTTVTTYLCQVSCTLYYQ